MWTTKTQIIDKDKIQKIMLFEEEKQLTFRQFFEYLKGGEAFRNFFIQLMKQAPFEAYFWETPPVTTTRLDDPFEFVFYKSNRLASVNADPLTFQKYFLQDNLGHGIVTFTNLGGDAILVVPVPYNDTKEYAHLAAFVRSAPEEQQDKFWQYVGIGMSHRINNIPVWLSTSGLGVYWLHMRLDNRPKYYQMQLYKKF